MYDVIFKIKKSPWLIVEVSAKTANEARQKATKQAVLEGYSNWYSIETKKVS